MEKIVYSLCPDCTACPEVVVTEQGVIIGEGENLVRLSRAEWNVLVEGVRSGKLGPLAAEEPTRCDCGCGS